MPSCRILASILSQGSVSMRIVRYHYQNQTAYGVYENDCVTPINGDIFGAYTFGEPPLPLSAVQLLAPIIPRQLFAIGLNYHDHVGELDFAKKLLLLCRYSSSVLYFQLLHPSWQADICNPLRYLLDSVK